MNSNSHLFAFFLWLCNLDWSKGVRIWHCIFLRRSETFVWETLWNHWRKSRGVWVCRLWSCTWTGTETMETRRQYDHVNQPQRENYHHAELTELLWGGKNLLSRFFSTVFEWCNTFVLWVQNTLNCEGCDEFVLKESLRYSAARPARSVIQVTPVFRAGTHWNLLLTGKHSVIHCADWWSLVSDLKVISWRKSLGEKWSLNHSRLESCT